MKPIPKKLLIHTIMLYEKTSIDKWGSEKLDDGQVLTKVRIEPSNQIVRDKNSLLPHYFMIAVIVSRSV